MASQYETLFGTPELAARFLNRALMDFDNDCNFFEYCSLCPYNVGDEWGNCGERPTYSALLEWLGREVDDA